MDRNAVTRNLSADERQIDIYYFSLKNKLGKGMFGTVFKALNIKTQQEVALKIVDKEDIKDPEDYKGLMNEIQIMRTLKSLNIVQIIDVIQSENNYYLVMEYCNSGDLEMALRKNHSIDHYKVLTDVLQGFIVLIRQGIVHRDLKPANILVHKQGGETIFKLGDFGFARLLRSFKREMLSSQVGSPLYMSPQLLLRENYTSKSDIWSLGLIFYQIVYFKTPWIGKTEEELLKKIISTPIVFPNKPKISSEAKEFIAGCLKVEEKDRFTWDEVYRHPYVASNFVKYIEVQKSLERKVSYLLANLREKASTLDLQTFFSQLDTSQDHALNIQEFAQLMWKIDKELEMGEIKVVFDEIDHDGNGDIDYNEFKKALHITDQPKFVSTLMDPRVNSILNRILAIIKKYKINLMDIFNKYDTSGNGSLDRHELHELLLKIDPTISHKDIEEAINVFDENGDGEIQFHEFRRVFDKIEQKRILSNQVKSRPESLKDVKKYFNDCSILNKQITDNWQEDEYGNLISIKTPPIQNQSGLQIIPMMLKKKKVQ